MGLIGGRFVSLVALVFWVCSLVDGWFSGVAAMG